MLNLRKHLQDLEIPEKMLNLRVWRKLEKSDKGAGAEEDEKHLV